MASAPAPATLERLAQQHLVVAHPVEIAGIEICNSGIERRVDGGDALDVAGGTIATRHAHASEAGGRDVVIGVPGSDLRMGTSQCWYVKIKRQSSPITSARLTAGFLNRGPFN